MKYRFMNEHRHQHAITTMCKVLRIARAGFYQWLHKPVSDRDQDNHRLLQLIRSSYAASRGVYGARRVFGDLREAGETCGKHRASRLMRTHKIKALRGYKAPPGRSPGGLQSSLPTISIGSSPSTPPIRRG